MKIMTEYCFTTILSSNGEDKTQKQVINQFLEKIQNNLSLKTDSSPKSKLMSALVFIYFIQDHEGVHGEGYQKIIKKH
jgi:hypothetical protein